jgi:N-methylhydantoinase A
MRYYGQEHTIKVPLQPGEYTSNDMKAIESSFIEAYQREYGFTLPGNNIELVSFHVVGFSRVTKPELPEANSEGSPAVARVGERDVYVGEAGWKKVPVYKKELLPKNTLVAGQAIIEEKTSTILVNQSFNAQTDKYGSIIIRAQ